MARETVSSIQHQYLKEQARANDLQEQLREKNARIKEREAQFKHTEDLVRELCTMILAKDRDEMVLGRPYSWRSVHIDELVEKASKSYKARNISMTKILNEIMDLAEHRRQQVESLTDQITQLMQRANVADPDSVRNVMTEINEQQQRPAQPQPPIKMEYRARAAYESGRIELIEEEDDDIEMVVSEERKALEEAAAIAQSASLAANAVPVIEAPKRKKMMEEINKETVVSHVVDLSEWTNKMTEPMWAIVETIGRHGMPLYKDIEAKVFESRDDMKKSSLRAAIQNLVRMNVVIQDSVRTPVAKKQLLHHLSDIGKRLYVLRFGEDPVLSEVEKVIAEHDNVEHGYGILELESVLLEKGIYKEVTSYNRKSAIKIDGQQRYVPDLICKKDGAKYVEYIEYERGTHTQTDFNAKCNKMAKVTRFLNFVVPKKDVVDHLVSQVDKWVEGRGLKSVENLKLRITTTLTIKDGTGKGIDWIVEYNFKNGATPIRHDVTL